MVAIVGRFCRGAAPVSSPMAGPDPRVWSVLELEGIGTLSLWSDVAQGGRAIVVPGRRRGDVIFLPRDFGHLSLLKEQEEIPHLLYLEATKISTSPGSQPGLGNARDVPSPPTGHSGLGSWARKIRVPIIPTTVVMAEESGFISLVKVSNDCIVRHSCGVVFFSEWDERPDREHRHSHRRQPTFRRGATINSRPPVKHNQRLFSSEYQQNWRGSTKGLKESRVWLPLAR